MQPYSVAPSGESTSLASTDDSTPLWLIGAKAAIEWSAMFFLLVILLAL
ncbi:hypothetical protein [Chrysiogenes arsenatis]|nr:hypothetical protein [Chrysiogenes arsenatis]